MGVAEDGRLTARRALALKVDALQREIQKEREETLQIKTELRGARAVERARVKEECKGFIRRNNSGSVPITQRVRERHSHVNARQTLCFSSGCNEIVLNRLFIISQLSLGPGMMTSQGPVHHVVCTTPRATRRGGEAKQAELRSTINAAI